jgi:hypothetical protein
MKIELSLNPADRLLIERLVVAQEAIAADLNKNLPALVEELKPEPPPVTGIEVVRGTPTTH